MTPEPTKTPRYVPFITTCGTYFMKVHHLPFTLIYVPLARNIIAKKYGDYLEAVHGSLGRYICNEKSFSCMSYLFSQFFKSSSHFVEEGWASSRGRP